METKNANTRRAKKKPTYLILRKSDERADDNTDPLRRHRRQLVAQRFTAPCGHHHQSIVTIEHLPHRLLGKERVEACARAMQKSARERHITCPRRRTGSRGKARRIRSRWWPDGGPASLRLWSSYSEDTIFEKTTGACSAVAGASTFSEAHFSLEELYIHTSPIKLTFEEKNAAPNARNNSMA